jgi:hypothetical protein
MSTYRDDEIGEEGYLRTLRPMSVDVADAAEISSRVLRD